MVCGYTDTRSGMVENRPNLKSMLRHEELASKERASVVMNKIMAAGSQELKVGDAIRREQGAGISCTDVYNNGWYFRLVPSLSLSLEKFKRPFKTW